MENARETIAECIGAKPSEIIFTIGSTEACALALNSMAMNGCRMHFSPYEHHAASELPLVTRAASYHTSMIRNGYVRMVANNETGDLYGPVVLDKDNEDDKNALVFRDATAAMGHLNLDVKTLGADYIAAGAHKFGGVPGAGFLWVKDGAPFYPFWEGGGQENGRRGGTENLPAICAMAAALKWQTDYAGENILKAVTLKKRLLSALESPLNGVDYLYNTDYITSVPHIVNLSFPGVEGSALVALLSSRGVAVSAGAACSTGNNEPSEVLMAKYHDEERARSAIRISFSHQNTVREVEEAVKILVECVNYLRSFSPTKS